MCNIEGYFDPYVVFRATEWIQKNADLNSVAFFTIKCSLKLFFEGFQQNLMHEVQQNPFFEDNKDFLLYIMQSKGVIMY